MSEFLSSRFRGTRALQLPKVSIIHNLGGMLAFFSLFIINNLQKAACLPPETWMIDGAIQLPLKSPDFQKSVDDGFCLIPFPGDTALMQQFQFSVSRRLETSRAEPSMTGLVKSEESPGRGMGQDGLGFCPNPNSIDGKKKSFPSAEGASPNTD